MKSRTSSERRRWRGDVKSLKRELLQREEVYINFFTIMYMLRVLDNYRKLLRRFLAVLRWFCLPSMELHQMDRLSMS